MKVKQLSIIIFLNLLFYANVFAQKITPEEYIERYKLIAIGDRFEHKIPASITLAQGILESGYGNSKLAVEANNHFGIKCHSDWKGKRIYKDDDEKDECFRVYDKVEESYNDHALFLTTRSRYEFLFDYDITDYKSWAKGLKKAGYATNPNYPKHLIELIERYKLDQYDKISEEEFQKMLIASGELKFDEAKKDSLLNPIIYSENTEHKKPYVIGYYNRIKYITVNKGDNIVDLAIIFNVTPRQIRKYNDLGSKADVKGGLRIYLQPKRKKSYEAKYHIVKKNESLWTISQKYGVKMKWIIKRNNLDTGVRLKVGQKILLRGEKR